MLYLDGNPLRYDVPFDHDGFQYPANWLRNATLEEKQAIGITEVADVVEPYYDQRFYWGVDNPKDHGELKTLWLANTRQTARQLLSETDWYVLRFIETSEAIPSDIADKRNRYRELSNKKEQAIAATANTDELAEYIKSRVYNFWEVSRPTTMPSLGSRLPADAATMPALPMDEQKKDPSGEGSET